MAPILWRLPVWGVELGNDAKPILRYADRLFKRDPFQHSLSEMEKEFRKKVKVD